MKLFERPGDNLVNFCHADGISDFVKLSRQYQMPYVRNSIS